MSMSKLFWAALCLFSIVCGRLAHASEGAVPAALTGSEDYGSTPTLKQAQESYRLGQYQDAELSLGEALDVWEQLDQPTKIQASLLKIRLRLAFSDEEEARVWARKLYGIDPGFEFDPVVDPPEVHAMWAEIGSEQMNERSAIQSKRSEARFWVSLLPYGVGHFDAGDLLGGVQYFTLGVTSLYIAPLFRGQETISPSHLTKDGNYLPNRISEVMFLGVWGYEVMDLLPQLHKLYPERAILVEKILSFAPFGVGQIQNNQVMKGFALASIESCSLLYSLLETNKGQKQRALIFSVLTMMYGAYDGWVNHRVTSPATKTISPPRRFSVAPFLINPSSTSHLGYGVAIRQPL